MEEQLQQEYLRLLEVLKVKDKIKRDYVDYKQILNEDFSQLNPKTKTYSYIKDLKEKLIEYMNSISLSHSDVLQLTYPDHNKVKVAVSTALQNIASESYGKDFCEFMNAFDEPALELINKQTSLFDDVDLRNRYALYKGVQCFANCLKDYLPFSDEKNSMTYVLYFVLERLKNEFNTKELYYLYEAKVDENKKLHIEDKYTNFLENCLRRNARLSNVIKSKYNEGFTPKFLLLADRDERGKLINLPKFGAKSSNDLESLIQPFFTEVENILFNENLPNLVDGKDTWLHRLERQKVKVVPFEVDEEWSLAKKFELALSQAAQYFKDQNNSTVQNYGRVLFRFLNDGTRLEEMNTSTTSERKRQILCDFVQRKKIESTTYRGLEFSAELKLQIEEVIKTFMYQPKAEFEKAIGIEREQIFYLLTIIFDFNSSGGENPIILSNNKVAVDKNIRCLKNSLRELLFPASKEIILADVEEKVNEDKSDGEFIRDLILATLDNDPDIEKVEEVEEGLYQLKKEKLGSAYLIQGRIMYEINDWRTFREIEEIYRQQFQEKKGEFQSGKLLKFESKVSPSMGFICMGKTGKWRFTEDKNGHENDIFLFLEKLLKDKEIVTIDEVMNLIRENDMPYELETIRSYLLGMCHMDESGSVFVLSDKKDEHPEYSWKRKNRAGTTNWAVNCAVNILQKQPSHKMAYKEFREKLLHFAKEEGYRSAVISIINSKPYNGEDKLFIQKNGFIELNQSVLDNTDLKFEGLYRKDLHFMDIFSYTFNALSHERESQLPLTELVKRITNQDGLSISGNTVRRAFDIDALLPDGLERFTVEGRVYIRLVNAKAIDEDEQYKVDNTVSSATDEAPSLVVDTTDRPAVTYQTVFNWKALRKIMKSELAFYENWDADNSIISEESLDKFQRFMEGSQNMNLKFMIPQDMYDNWYAFTNRFSIYHYFMDLALNFEGLLIDISRRNGKEVAGKGLSEICEEYYLEYYNVIRNHDVTTGTRYSKIMKSLHINRNQISHGDGRPIEMNSIQLMTNVLNYIALYIRTVVKYYEG